MTYSVYVLRSLRDGSMYTGMTTDVARRLEEHNAGQSKFTKGHRPYVLVYTEACADRLSARKREVFLKSGSGREFINQHIPR